MSLSIQDLSYVRPDFQLTATLRAPQGITLLHAPSGAGKSTLFKLLCGFLQPHGGYLAWEDRAFHQLPTEQRPLSFLDQGATVFMHLTVQKNLEAALWADPLATAAKAQKIQEILEALHLQQFRHQVAETLSGGQRQRLAFAQAYIQERPLLLLDEPFQGLDHENRLRCYALLKKRHKHHPTFVTLMASHAKEEQQLLNASVVFGNTGVFRS